MGLLAGLVVAVLVAVYAARWVADLGNAILYRLPRVRFGLPGRARSRPRWAVARGPFHGAPGAAYAVGRVFYDGAVWNARLPGAAAGQVQPGDLLEVERVEHLELILSGKVKTD